MKRFISILVFLSFAICLLSCSYKGTYEDGYADGYSDGYSDGKFDMQSVADDNILAGYDTGYFDGITEAQHDIAIRVEDELWSLAWDIEDEYGLLPEDALQILFNYADAPDDADEDEVTEAIWAIRRYYYASNEIINDIEDYLID